MTIINTNLKALAAQESSRSSDLKMSQSMERLSTGLKINSAKDDAAGLAISNRMTAQIRGFAKAIQNTNDAISMNQTAGGAIDNVTGALQRMRELAVQASNGTLNASDRASIQTEVSQLQTQIDSIAQTTNFNNIKLLDGSAQNVVIQTGVKAGDTTKLAFDSMQTKDIGVGSKAVVTSAGGLVGTNAALSANYLYLNGVAVGASFAADDNASSTSNSASAIAKAVAINRVSAASGVYAKADTNTVSGAAMTGAALTGTISINGVATDSVTTTTDTALSRQKIAQAINAKSAQTGVTAIDMGDDKLGIQLQAADGRNIDISFNTLTSAATGVAAAGTFVGSYDLFTLDGRSINVSSTSGTGANSALSQAGLQIGTYAADTATMTSVTRTAALATVAPTSALQGQLDGSAMVINGVQIGAALTSDDTASDTTAASSVRSFSAIAIAAAINRSSAQTGVKATAAPNVIKGESFTAAAAAAGGASVYLNGVTFTANNTTLNGLIDSFNAVSNQTGVVASAVGGAMQLTAQDGRNISIGVGSGDTSAGIGLGGVTIAVGAAATAASTDAKTFYSQVTLTSANSFTVKAGSTGITNLNKLGFREGTFGGTTGTKVNQIDMSTAAGASLAISVIDAAINTASTAQAKVGAYANRLSSVIDNLSTFNQNTQASRSRITDTDYSMETTNLAKQQIIQQAATAMLAQANQSAQSVLSLLK
jgi:flagellin